MNSLQSQTWMISDENHEGDDGGAGGGGNSELYRLGLARYFLWTVSSLRVRDR